MSGFVGILVSNPWLQNQFRQVELRSSKSHFMSIRRESGKLTMSDLASRMGRSINKKKRMGRSKVVGDQNLSNEERASLIQSFHPNLNDEVDFEFYLRVWDTLLDANVSRKYGSNRS